MRTQRHNARHDEWLIDTAIEETFPASDPIAPAQPGSLVSTYYRGRRRARFASGGPREAALWWIAAGSALCVAALLVARRRRR